MSDVHHFEDSVVHVGVEANRAKVNVIVSRADDFLDQEGVPPFIRGYFVVVRVKEGSDDPRIHRLCVVDFIE